MKESTSKEQSGHPSRNFAPRARGYGIGGGYERPYRAPVKPADAVRQSYGPVPHSGYYGAGVGYARFKPGQAGYDAELSWYGPQYGDKTSGKRDGS
ncbi:MAG TPA: hypothetical protein VGL29_24385 [Blastocatellia bacterium]